MIRPPKTIRSYHGTPDQGVSGEGGGGPYGHQELESRVISCENPENERMRKTNNAALYFCIVSTIMGLVLLVETHPGRSAMSYLPDRITRGRWNERMVRQLLQNQRAWAFQLGRRHVREQQRQRRRRLIMLESSSSPQNVVGDPPAGVGMGLEEEELELWECYKKYRTQKLTSLVLPTTVYREATVLLPSSEDNHGDNVEEHEVECSICLAPLESGDRIGKLPCRHPMHVECLKSWLQRQNACPLCKRRKIAQPRYTDKNDRPTRARMDELSNTRRTDGTSSTDDIMRESEEAVDSIEGLGTLDAVGAVEDEQSVHQQEEGTTVPCGNGQESPL